MVLQQQLKPKAGRVLEIENTDTIFNYKDNELLTVVDRYPLENGMTKDVGSHEGAHYFTEGQRKGLGIGGTKEPLFVIGTDTVSNIVYVGQGTDHNGLYRKGLKVKKDEVHWIRPDLKLEIGESKSYMGRIRYRQALVELMLHQEQDFLYVTFSEDQRGVAAGQFVAWYENNELIGSGVIFE